MGLWMSSASVVRADKASAPSTPAPPGQQPETELRWASSWSRSLLLLRESFSVLWKNQKLLVFPILAGFSVLAVAAGFAVRLLEAEAARNYFASGRLSSEPLVLLFLWYYFHYFVILFFGGALMDCANRSMQGEAPSLREGLRAAARRWFQIAMWTLAAATLGVACKLVERLSRRLAGSLAALAGFTWTLATYFVMPALLFDEDRLFGAVRRSVQVSRKAWGEQISNYAGLGLFAMLFAIPGAVLAVAAMFLSWTLLLPAIAYCLMLTVVLSAARTVSNVALYRYAVTGQVPQGFSRRVMVAATGGK